MPDPIQSRVNSAFCDILIALTEHAKTQATSSVLIALQLSALKACVKGLDPTFSDVFEQKKKVRDQAADLAGISDEGLIAPFDEQIRILRDIKRLLDDLNQNG